MAPERDIGKKNKYPCTLSQLNTTLNVTLKCLLMQIGDGCMYGWMDGWTNGWMDGWVDGWMGGWMDGWNDGWFLHPITSCSGEAVSLVLYIYTASTSILVMK